MRQEVKPRKDSNLQKNFAANLKFDAPELMQTGPFQFHDDLRNDRRDNIDEIELLAETAGGLLTNNEGNKHHRR